METKCQCGNEKGWDDPCCEDCREKQCEKEEIDMENTKETEVVLSQKSPSQMIEMAVAGKADLEQLEKLLALQERWEANEARKAYHKAMAEFKANPPQINKDKKVGYKTSAGTVGYSHASLYNVTEKINSELSKYGLSASWMTKQNGQIIVTCKITHSKGHSEETSLSAPADTTGSKNVIQAIGSTITYLERYTLLALTGLATFEQDNDAQGPVDIIGDKELHWLRDQLLSLNADETKFIKYLDIDELEKMPVSLLPKAKAAIEASRTKKLVKK